MNSDPDPTSEPAADPSADPSADPAAVPAAVVAGPAAAPVAGPAAAAASAAATAARAGASAPVAAVEPTPATTPAAAPGALASLLGDTAARRWYRRPGLWAGAAGLLLTAAGAAWWFSGRAARAAPSYTTQTVARGDITLSVTANGTVQPTRTISIGSELSGTVLKVNVDVNDSIRKGQVLVVLDTAKLRDQILRSQATLTAARARTAQTAATIAEARAALGRLEAVAALSGGKVPSAAELDAGRATLARALADDGSARAGISDAQAALSTDQINLSKASIAAPADGVVLTRTVDPGNAVAASLQAVTLFTVAEDLKKLRLWVYVDEADVGAVKVGQAASFTVSAYLSRPFPARITRVGFGSTITDNVVTYLTYLDVANADLSLRPGMTATATIVADQRKDVLLVPNAALRFTPTVAGSAPKGGIASGMVFGPPRTESRRKGAADGASTAAARQVWVLPGEAGKGQEATAAPVAVAVTPGISDGHMTEITGGDLKAGMQVVTAQKAAPK
jgi:HlyD family secretion protein